MRRGKVCRDAVAGEPVAEIGEVERPAVEGDVDRSLRFQVRKDSGECRLLLFDGPEQVLADDDRPAVNPGKADEDDRPGREPQRLDVEEEKLLGGIIPADIEEEGVASSVVPPLDPGCKTAGVLPRHRRKEPFGLRAVEGVPDKVGNRPVAHPPQSLPGRLADTADQGEVGEDGRSRPVGASAVKIHGTPGFKDVARPGGAGDFPAAEDILDRPAPILSDEVA